MSGMLMGVFLRDCAGFGDGYSRLGIYGKSYELILANGDWARLFSNSCAQFSSPATLI